MDSVSLYSPCLGVKGLDESELNLTLLAVQGRLIDGSATQAKLEMSMVCNNLENVNDVRIQGLIVDVEVDVHNRTSIMYLLPDSKGF